MYVAGFKILDCGRCLLLCTFLILTLKTTEGFWPFSDNAITTPTLNFYPEDPDSDRGNTLIYYKHNDTRSSQKYIDSMTSFLKDYKDKETPHKNSVYCDYDSPPPPNKFCRFRPVALGRCSAERGYYGYVEGSPCVFLTLSKLENWIPNTFNANDVAETHENDPLSKMPTYLKYSILNVRPNHNMIWVSCHGENPIDNENIGSINFYPQRGFPAHYFPFTNVEGYQSPIVAIQLERPKYGIVISVECKLWAKNIKLDRNEGIGYAKFNLMID